MEIGNDFRIIPNYENYAVNKIGVVVSVIRNKTLKQCMLNGYMIVNTFRGSLTETLPVHRAVALAWVNNPDPKNYTVVNHIDGNCLNNAHTNLEWTDHSGNNMHAIENDLRVDNIECKVRDFLTKEVIHFKSIAQAAKFVGLRKDSSIKCLQPKMFGKLINGRYEFKFEDDQSEWFYENRPNVIKPLRFMVIVSDKNNNLEEFYSSSALMKKYGLYNGPYGKSMQGLARWASELYTDKEFVLMDSYLHSRFRVYRQTKSSVKIVIVAKHNNSTQVFDSLTKCAKHFNVDRSTIFSRLNTEKQLDGWTFTDSLSTQ